MENVIYSTSRPIDKFFDHTPNNSFLKRTSIHTISNDMFDLSPENKTEIPLTDFFLPAIRYDKDYYKKRFPAFDEEIHNILKNHRA